MTLPTSTSTRNGAALGRGQRTGITFGLGESAQYGNVEHLATGIGTELFGLQHEAAEAEAVDPARAGGAFAVLEGNGALKRVAAVTSRGCPEFCVRSINMTNRIIYAKQNEVEERSHCRPKRGAA